MLAKTSLALVFDFPLFNFLVFGSLGPPAEEILISVIHLYACLACNRVWDVH